MKIIAVIPAYEEALRIRAVVREALRFAQEVVVIDDCSKDQTGQIAREAGALVIRHRLNRDQGAALKTGNLAALRLGAEIIIHLDADGQHNPEDIPKIVEPILQGKAEVVFGSRSLGLKPVGIPLERRILHVGIKWFNKVFMGIPFSITDPQSGFRAMTSAAVRELDFKQRGKAHCSEILKLAVNSRYRIVEVPIRVIYTVETLAKGNKTRDVFKITWQLILGAFQNKQ
ncbi:MAG: glycosyltransferase family 2 protein [bacterium]